jgi:hypothetical protein
MSVLNFWLGNDLLVCRRKSSHYWVNFLLDAFLTPKCSVIHESWARLKNFFRYSFGTTIWHITFHSSYTVTSGGSLVAHVKSRETESKHSCSYTRPIPFSRVMVDWAGPLPKTKYWNLYLLTIMCASSRFPEAIPLSNIILSVPLSGISLSIHLTQSHLVVAIFSSILRVSWNSKHEPSLSSLLGII